MPRFRVMSRRYGSIELNATNWLNALGHGLEQMGVMEGMERMACEVLRNGQVLVRDACLGEGFVVQPMGFAEVALVVEENNEDLFEAPEDTHESTVHQIDALRNAPGVHTAIQIALNLITHIVSAESAAVLELQQDESLIFLAATGPSAEVLMGHSIPKGVGFAGFCVRHVAALNIHEPYADSRFHRDVDAITGHRTRSLMVVPIRYQEKIYGCLEVVNARGPYGFPRSAMADAELVAGALAERMAHVVPEYGKASPISE